MEASFLVEVICIYLFTERLKSNIGFYTWPGVSFIVSAIFPQCKWGQNGTWICTRSFHDLFYFLLLWFWWDHGSMFITWSFKFQWNCNLEKSNFCRAYTRITSWSFRPLEKKSKSKSAEGPNSGPSRFLESHEAVQESLWDVGSDLIISNHYPIPELNLSWHAISLVVLELIRSRMTNC